MDTAGATEPAVAEEPVPRKELRPRCYQLELFEEAKQRNVRWPACLSVTRLLMPHNNLFSLLLLPSTKGDTFLCRSLHTWTRVRFSLCKIDLLPCFEAL